MAPTPSPVSDRSARLLVLGLAVIVATAVVLASVRHHRQQGGAPDWLTSGFPAGGAMSSAPSPVGGASSVGSGDGLNPILSSGASGPESPQSPELAAAGTEGAPEVVAPQQAPYPLAPGYQTSPVVSPGYVANPGDPTAEPIPIQVALQFGILPTSGTVGPQVSAAPSYDPWSALAADRAAQSAGSSAAARTTAAASPNRYYTYRKDADAAANGGTVKFTSGKGYYVA